MTRIHKKIRIKTFSPSYCCECCPSCREEARKNMYDGNWTMPRIRYKDHHMNSCGEIQLTETKKCNLMLP